MRIIHLLIFILGVSNLSATDVPLFKLQPQETLKDSLQVPVTKSKRLSYSLHIGNYAIEGDFSQPFWAGIGASFGVSKNFSPSLAIGVKTFYGQHSGISAKPFSAEFSNRFGALVETEYDAYDQSNGHPDGYWFPSFRTRQFSLSLNSSLNLFKLISKKSSWDLRFSFGAGLIVNQTKLDLLDSNELPYTDLLVKANYTLEKFDTKKGRSEIRNELKTIYDNSYESSAPSDPMNNNLYLEGALSFGRKITNRMSIGVQYLIMFKQSNDYLDGIKYRAAFQPSAQNDRSFFTSFYLRYH